MQQFDVRSKEKNTSGRIALAGATLFMVALTVIAVVGYFNEPTQTSASASVSDMRLALKLPLSLRDTEAAPKNSDGEMQTVPSRYTHQVSVDTTCNLKLTGVTATKNGSVCRLVIDQHIWTDGLATGEPEHIKPQSSADGELAFALSGKAVLFLNSPAISPRYELSASALGNHVMHYTPRGVVWIDFE